MKHTDLFTQCGLNPDQARIYESLLTKGPQKASQLSEITDIQRSLVYYTLKQLATYKLVEKDETNKNSKVTLYRAVHPQALLDRTKQIEQMAQDARTSLTTILPDLARAYSSATERPSISFHQGIKGVKAMYDGMLAEGKDLYFLRSSYEPTYEQKIKPIVRKFIKNRVERGMMAIALSPPKPKKSKTKTDKTEDDHQLCHRTTLPAGAYTAPVEIDIYGNKVSFLSFGKELIGATIDSVQITKAFRELFQLAKKGSA